MKGLILIRLHFNLPSAMTGSFISSLVIGHRYSSGMPLSEGGKNIPKILQHLYYQDQQIVVFVGVIFLYLTN